ncbi:hypothetical protein SteCoe_21560 [Stentor coeruleus]|uniref:Chitinase domain-containing protein 1 n=1 Tax=Stentor coeruleus TaxID=5963 RepID=A0A1R2BP57_9CILI|nr:hypothetical protein SteCoe_21560 [Stentor coeruleus]
MIYLISLLYLVSGSLKDEILSTHTQCTEDHKHFQGETLAYLTPWNSLGYKYALKYPSKFTYVSPVWHELSFYYSAGETDFAITGDEDMNFLNSARGKIKIVPRLIITKTHPRAYISILNSDKQISRLAQAIIAFCQKNQYQGIVFEFWLQGLGILNNLSNYAELRALQLRMLTMISKAMIKVGLVTILTLPPMRNNEITSSEFLTLVESFHRVNLMTYDFSPATPGPNAPMPWIKDTLSKLYSGNEVDNTKILLGVPFYGYDYKEGHGQPVIGKEFIDILNKNVKDIWEDSGKEHKFIYNNAGRDCVVYYPTLDMISERLAYAERHGMGIGIWELGQGLEYFFTLF